METERCFQGSCVLAMVPVLCADLGRLNMRTALMVQVDPYLNVVKGRGGALLREKVSPAAIIQSCANLQPLWGAGVE